MRDLGQPANVGVNAAAPTQATKTRSLVVGRNMGACMIDSAPYSGAPGTTPTFTSCLSNPGVSAGRADSCGAALEGQCLDIDGLKSGDHVLEVQVDTEQLLPETSHLDNSTAIKVRHTARQGCVPVSIQAVP